MPRDRRARRSLPSAVERNLSLGELLGDEDAQRHARRRKSQEAQQRAALESLNAYFAMIDKTELKVEKATSPPPSPAGEEEQQKEEEEEDKAASDSELVRPTVSAACRTQRTVRRRNLRDKRLQAEYQIYCEATGGVVKPRSIEEFARSIEPEAKKGMYEGILDVCPV